MFKVNYNPDVLSCLSNLSSDEVFTPPSLVNDMLDMLPEELWRDKNVTFLDPVSKSGVFLREIAKRLTKGLKEEFPDRQERVNHIFQNQLFGIAITELTSLLSRRSVYCSKYANGKYSVCTEFETEEGNILYNRTEHTWKNGNCVYCGASKSEYDRDKHLETHAYQFIHTENPEELFDMRFDVIVGNPPYQLDTGGSGRQATPIYNLFVEQAKKLKPHYITMIIPSRWFAGGMGLNDFREEMLNDKRIKHITDYTDAKECFPGVSISGGVNYFLWDRDYNGPCEFVNVQGDTRVVSKRYLNQFPILVRYNKSVDIINKIASKREKTLDDVVCPINVFGISSSFRGSKKSNKGDIKVHHSKGVGYIDKKEEINNKELIDKYKVLVSRTISEHAGEPGKDGKFKVLAKTDVLKPNEICTHSYLIVDTFDNELEAKNMLHYLSNKLVRFLILQTISSIDLSRKKFMFVPAQDFNELWTDEKLYEKYNLNQEEIAFIESMIRPMELDNE
ncbi:MAG: Eco57I restriction-modification methylase domain-containing protein [Gracilimonas sp.]|uniref:Eco57I restriction-modification methylase domain-containing protein n=1 Tax=Gracilimonas sp. TaxID=1974203 RepID=UPI0037517212|nr:Eco57I restriction-modification methylase domain-containing protein [Gracilimonas sp.]